MYESFFGFHSRPFTAAPNPKLYFAAGAIEHARQTLVRSVERADGIAVVIGPSGSGKTLLLSMLAEQFHERFHVASLASARLCTRRALLQNILFELKLPYRNMEEGELRLSLIDHLEPETSRGMVLLVDEAHTLPMRLLEEIRMITNLVRDGEPRVRLVLAGTRALEERLSHPKLDSLNQRVSARCFLEPLSADETRGMVRQQIESVGGVSGEVFSEEALTAIHQATDGVPRLINQVADHALLLAGVGGVKPVHADGINEAWSDLQQLPLPWNASNPERETATAIEFGALDDEDSLLSDSLFEETTIEVEDFAPAAEEIDQDQVALRVAPETFPGENSHVEIDDDEALIFADNSEHGADSEQLLDAAFSIEAFEEEALEAEAFEEEAMEDPVDIHSADESTQIVAIAALDDSLIIAGEDEAPAIAEIVAEELEATPISFTANPPALANVLAGEASLVGEPAYPLDVMDDPFDESFEAEEVVIESQSESTGARIKVEGGALSKALANLLRDVASAQAASDLAATQVDPLPIPETAAETQAWTIDVEALDVDPIIEVAQAESLLGVLGDGPIIAAEVLLEAAADSEEALASVVQEPLSDAEEWEPAFPSMTPAAQAASPEEEPQFAGDAEPREDIMLDDGDMIILDDDDPPRNTAPAPKARAVVRDYRRLFAQLRRG